MEEKLQAPGLYGGHAYAPFKLFQSDDVLGQVSHRYCMYDAAKVEVRLRFVPQAG